ncbi:MAG TPA: poly-gamma-glutamate system protein, partial [Clostridia bacterium]|nr:poly-gamma-glutamate system protein [Clostridia bacterium]
MRASARRRWALLSAALTLLVLAVGLISSQGRMTRTHYVDVQLDARARMIRCLEAIRGYRTTLGLTLSEEDTWKSGLIGAEYTEITTTIGAIEAKRTATDPDMAALLVRMFIQAGLRPGDRVGAGFSGSFPGLNLAVICAADALGLKLCYISSVGSSTFGANLPELTFPDMAHRLYTDGLISTDSALVTPGGDYDIGKGVLDESAFEPILARIASWGIAVLREPDFEKNLAARRVLYAQNGIDCFVAAGGNITSMGKGDSALTLGQGLLHHAIGAERITVRSGLVEWYLAQGIPVINLLNIRKIVADYALPFDPVTRAPAGQSPVYYTAQYPRGWIAAAFIVAVGLLVSVGIQRKRTFKN